VNLNGRITDWVIQQLELMPRQALEGGASRLFPYRIVSAVLGDREAAEIRALMSSPARDTRTCTVLLPGIMGSLLSSVRGIGALLWLNPAVILDGYINLLNLNEEGTADASPDVDIVPSGIEKLTYFRIVVTLARESRLFEFPYDWRRALEFNARVLRDSIEKWSAADPHREFVLVGHSMGGMLIRTYLAMYPALAEKRVRKAILIGSPLRGAAKSVLAFTGGTLHGQIVSGINEGNDVVSFAAGLPATYQLLPPPMDLWDLERPYPLSWDPYDASAWGLDVVRQDYLRAARSWHERLAQSDPQLPLIQIAGCHMNTITDVALAAADHCEEPFLPAYTDIGLDSGDQSVPLWSSLAEGVQSYFVQERHQSLVSNPQVLDALPKLIYDDDCDLPKVLPPPHSMIGDLRARPMVQQAAELRERLRLGRLRREDIDRLFFAR